MYRSFADGMLLTEISEELARRGILNRRGQPFGKTSILRILDQEKYRGFSILQRTYIESNITHRKKMNHGRLPRFVVEGTHPRIIGEELHQRVEAERERRRQAGAVSWRTATCFTGKLTCGCCSSTLTYTTGTSTNKDDLTEFQQGQYRCSNKRNNGLKACSARNLPLRALRQACCSSLGPLFGASEDAGFDPAWIDGQVKRIVVFADALEFHLHDARILTTPWKSTARRDAWVLRRQKMARMQVSEEKQ